jgi:Flp pilus assembly protein TadG
MNKAVQPAPGRRALRQAARWLRRGERSAVSMELGIIAIPFFAMFLGTMEISYDLYVQAAMDNAVEIAARGVQVGSTAGVAGEKSGGSTGLVATSVCPNLGGLLDCNLLTVSVEAVPIGSNYYTYPVSNLTQTNANNGTGICTGTGGRMMILRAWYNGPTFVGLLVPSFTSVSPSGTIVHLTTASAGFVDEYFTGGEAC